MRPHELDLASSFLSIATSGPGDTSIGRTPLQATRNAERLRRPDEDSEDERYRKKEGTLKALREVEVASAGDDLRGPGTVTLARQGDRHR